MIAGSFILYSLYYFELEPPYLCQKADKSWSECTKKEICDDKGQFRQDVVFKIDYDDKSKGAVFDWIDQYSLECASDFHLSMIGSCFFIGCFVGSFILPRLADVYGRKPLFLTGLILYFITVLGLLMSTSQILMYSFLILGGVSETGRYYVAYVYAIEIFPKRLQSLMGLVIFMMFASFKVLICIYFWQSESKNWRVCGYVALSFTVISFILVFFCVPESPRFLASSGKSSEAIAVLTKVQQINSGANKQLVLTP